METLLSTMSKKEKKSQMNPMGEMANLLAKALE